MPEFPFLQHSITSEDASSYRAGTPDSSLKRSEVSYEIVPCGDTRLSFSAPEFRSEPTQLPPTVISADSIVHLFIGCGRVTTFDISLAKILCFISAVDWQKEFLH